MGSCGAGGSQSTSQLGRALVRGAGLALNYSQVMIDRHLHAIDKHHHDVENQQGWGYKRQEATFEKFRALVVSAMALKAMMWTSRLDYHHENQDLVDEDSIQVGTKMSNVLADMDRYQDELRQLNVCQDGNPTTSTAA